MNELGQDAAFAWRMLRKAPLASVVIVLTLAIGIGANTAIFSVLRSVLFEPLPYVDADSLVVPVTKARQFERTPYVNGKTYTFVRDNAPNLDSVAAHKGCGKNLMRDGAAVRIGCSYASDNLFDVLGADASHGRTFVPESESGEPEAVLGHEIHRELFGDDGAGVGKTITLDGTDFRVAGVMPAQFRFPYDGESDLWLRNDMSKEPFASVMMVARRGAVSHDQLVASADQLTAAYCARPESRAHCERSEIGFDYVSMREQLFGETAPYAWALSAAVALLLLLACVNVANLLLARAATRRRELALRIALGATRTRLIRQLLTESAIIALLGGALGMLVALWGVDALSDLAGAGIIRGLPAPVFDAAMAGYALLLCLFTVFVFGLLPAVAASARRPHSDLKAGGHQQSGGRGAGRMRRTLVVAQVALALILLGGAGLSARSLMSVRNVDPGFDTHGLLTARVSPDRHAQPDATLPQFVTSLQQRIEALPGVEGAAMSLHTMLAGWGNPSWSYSIVGRDNPSGAEYFDVADWRVVTPGYFNTLGIDIIAGRTFTGADRADTTRVIVVDDLFAAKAWPNEAALGKQITIGVPKVGDVVATVVGVVRHINDVELGRDRSREKFYWPYAQWQPAWRFLSVVARIDGPPEAVAAAMQDELRAIDPATPMHFTRTVDELIDMSLTRQRLTTILLIIFAALAALLSVVGLYSLLSYSVTRRTRELGIRIALGAPPRRVLATVVQSGVALSVLGALIGTAVVLGLLRIGEDALAELSITTASGGDMLLLSLLAGVMCVVAAIASWLPARRAARVEPAIALRYE